MKPKLSFKNKGKKPICGSGGSLNLSGGASPALSTSAPGVLVLLRGRASLQVDFQDRLVDELGRAVGTGCWLLIWNRTESV